MSKVLEQILDEFEDNIHELNPVQSLATFETVKRYVVEQIDLIRTVVQEEERIEENLDMARVRADYN